MPKTNPNQDPIRPTGSLKTWLGITAVTAILTAPVAANLLSSDKAANSAPVEPSQERHAFVKAVAEGKMPPNHAVKVIIPGENPIGIGNELGKDEEAAKKIKEDILKQVGNETGMVESGDRVLLPISDLHEDVVKGIETYPVAAGIYIDGQTGTIEMPVVMTAQEESISQK